VTFVEKHRFGGGVPEPRPPMDWAQLRHQALTFTRAAGSGSGTQQETS